MLANDPNNSDKTPPHEAPRSPEGEPPIELSMPPVARVEEIRGETGLIRMEHPVAGDGSRGSLMVIVSGPNGDQAARFALSPPPDAAALSEISGRLHAVCEGNFGPVGKELWYKKAMKELACLEEQDSSARFVRLPDSREHRLSPIPPMTPLVLDFHEYAQCPDLPRRSLVCSRAYGDHFLRLETFADRHTTGVYYLLRLITSDGQEELSDALVEQRFELNRHSMGSLQRVVEGQMRSFWNGSLQEMEVVGPLFSRWVQEKLAAKGELAPAAASAADAASAEVEPVPGALALPTGVILQIEEESKFLSLVARRDAQDSGSSCIWQARVPPDAGERRAQIRAVFRECRGLLATQDSEKINRALLILRKAGAPLYFTRASTSEMIGAEAARSLHRKEHLCVDMGDIPEIELVSSVLAGDDMVRFDVPRLPRRWPMSDIYERLTITHKADGTLEADSLSMGRTRMVLRLSPDVVHDAGGVQGVSRHLLGAFAHQDRTSGFAFERACKELVDPEHDEGSWLLMYEDEYGRRPSKFDIIWGA